MEKNGVTPSLVVAHGPRLGLLDILRVITRTFVADAPIVIQTVHSPQVAVILEAGAIGLEVAQSIAEGIHALQTARAAVVAPTETAPLALQPAASETEIPVGTDATATVNEITQIAGDIAQAVDESGLHKPLV
jgi:hypothetical protein